MFILQVQNIVRSDWWWLLKTPEVDIAITKSNQVFMKMKRMFFFFGNWAPLLSSSVHWTVTVYSQGNFAGNKISFQ